MDPRDIERLRRLVDDLRAADPDRPYPYAKVKPLIRHKQTGYVVQLRSVDSMKIATVAVHHGPREGVVFQCPTHELESIG